MNLWIMTTDNEQIQHNHQRRRRVSMMIMQRNRREKNMQNREECVLFRELCMWVESDHVHDLNWRSKVQRIACRDNTKYKGRREAEQRY
jgi:hypothetical protein